MKFKEGQKIKMLCWNGDCSIDNQYCSIEVIMENGQMAEVPWALATYTNGRVDKFNLAKMDSVQLEMDDN